MIRPRNIIVCLVLAACATVGSADRYVWQANPSPAAPFDAWTNAAQTIQAAVDVALPGETVWVTNGTYATGSRKLPGADLANRVIITNAITVESVSGPESALIVGAPPMGINAIRCVFMSAGTLSGFTLTNGYTANNPGGTRDDVGGGALADGGLLTNCIITGCASRNGGGGAAYSRLVDCRIRGNTVGSWNGGGLFESRAEDCEISGNSAGAWSGGGAAVSTLIRCVVSNNFAPWQGGGGYDCIMTNSTVCVNVAYERGGGVQLGRLDGCMLTGNFASNYAGGASSATLIDCDIIGNRSTNGGGAAMCTLIDCTVSNNTASKGGGAYGCPISNCVITANTADLDGGGTYGDGGGAMVDSTISHNVAGWEGGGMRGGSPVNCNIVSNSARTGGGMWTASPSRCNILGNSALYGGGCYQGTISDCVISNNTADYGGGVDYCWVNGCTIVDNRAVFDGGGAYNCSALLRCTVKNNVAGRNGGGFWRPINNDVENCLIVGNVASNAGGGVYIGKPLQNCTIVSNTAAIGGGTYSNTLINCIVYYNSAPAASNNLNPVSCTYSCTSPDPGGAGNLTGPPLFLDIVAGDYRLSYGSPCLDSGTDMSASYVSDIDGTTRPLDGDYDGTNAYDMGAYEYDPATADSDRDLMPDWWEHMHTLNPTNAADATGHADADGVENLSEYIADTVPTSAVSRLWITAVSNLSNVVVCFPSSSNRVYTLTSRTNLLAGNWTNVPGQASIPGNGGADSLSDTNAAGGVGYYRLRVALP